jgi:fumarate reductase flavoprotein subunit
MKDGNTMRTTEAPWHERQWDLIVMGAGTAGMTAANFAGKRGGQVLVVEAAAGPGGSLLVSHGQISAAGTKLQAERGIVDSPEKHFEEALSISKGSIDHELARLAIFNAGETFDWLMDNGYEPLPQCPALGSAHEPYSVARYYWGKDLGRSLSRVLVKCLDEEIASGRVTLQAGTRIIGLLQDETGAVIGVETEEADGTRRRVLGRNVLLAAGGYAANPEMFERMVGRPLYARAAYAQCQGAGIELGLAAGGYVRGREKYLSNFGWLLEDDRFPSPIIGRVNTYPNERQPWEIYVNSEARRFIREDEPSVDVREHTLLEQPHLRYWVIFDQSMFEQATPIVYNWSREQMAEAFNQKFAFSRADTLEDLARAIGLDPHRLVATVREYNAGQASGRDAFGRQHMPAPIGTGPFHAIRQQGASVTSTVGLAVDGDLRVIRADGSAVPNLYAAGEILGSGQTQGFAFVGGMMAMPALVFGRLLGQRLIPF